MLLNSQIQAFIHLDKPTYSPGEQVNGTVSLEVNTPVQATDLELKFLGGEFVHFVQLEREKAQEIGEESKSTEDRPAFGNYTQNRIFYNFENSIYEFRKPGTEIGIIEPGQYQFPFSFVLGVETPASFNYSWKNYGHSCNATIQYIITANIIDKSRGIRQGGAGVAGNLAHKELIVLPVDDGLGRNRRVENAENISFCCKDYGETKMIAYFEKDRYSIGSTAFIILEIDNRYSTADIKDVDVKLTQRLSFKAQGQEQRKISVLKEVKGEGCKAHSSQKGNNARRFEIVISGSKPDEKDIFGSCHGELVECRHRISITLNMGITCYMGKSPQVHLDIPVYKVYGDHTDLYPSFMASNWNPQINATFMFNPQYAPANKLDISINPFTTGRDTDLSTHNEEFQRRRYQELERLSESGILHKLDLSNSIVNRHSMNQSLIGYSTEPQYGTVRRGSPLAQRPSMMQQPTSINRESRVIRRSPVIRDVIRELPREEGGTIRIIGDGNPKFSGTHSHSYTTPAHQHQHQHEPEHYQPEHYQPDDYQLPRERNAYGNNTIYDGDETTMPLFDQVEYEPNY